MVKNLYVVMCGPTLFNKKSDVQGDCNSTFSEAGLKQTENLKKYFSKVTLTNAYAPMSDKCCNLLEAITEGKLSYIKDESLNEMNFGTYHQDKNSKNKISRPIKFSGEHYFKNFGGESITEAKERVKEACTNIMEQEGHESVITVFPVGNSFSFLFYWVSMDEFVGLRKSGLASNHSCIFKYEYENKTFNLIDIIRFCK